MSSVVSPAPNRKRARWVGLVLAVVALGLGAAGAFLYSRTSQRLREDPGLAYRTPESFDKMLARGEAAERAGHRDAAIDAYRFIVKVGAAGVPELARYVDAARRNLARLGAEPQP
jgi:predicted Zn-dependent peptidase